MKNKNNLNQYGYYKKECRLCKSKKLFKFLDLGYHPPSDQFKSVSDLNQVTLYFPLELCSCNKCGFKQLNFVVDASYLYQDNYPYESSLTKAGKDHYTKFAQSIIDRFNLKKKI